MLEFHTTMPMNPLSHWVMADIQKVLQKQVMLLTQVGEMLEDRIKDKLSHPGTRSSHAQRGVAPLEQTGLLRDSTRLDTYVSWNGVIPEAGFVLFNAVSYGQILERTHPWFFSTIEENEANAQAIFGGTP
jgi:hypothetical protein